MALEYRRNGYKHFEADMFFERDGKYLYDPSKIAAAHQWCQRKTREALSAGYSVVVSNTFTRRFELEPYIEMARELDAALTIIEAKGCYQNVHGVPDSVIEKMHARWESL